MGLGQEALDCLKTDVLLKSKGGYLTTSLEEYGTNFFRFLFFFVEYLVLYSSSYLKLLYLSSR